MNLSLLFRFKYELNGTEIWFNRIDITCAYRELKVLKALSLDGYYYKPLIHATWACFLQHFFWIFLFYWLDVPVLSIINAISCCFYLLCIYLVRQRKYKLFRILVISEVLANISFTTYIMGWGAGFHYYLFILIYGTFFVPRMQYREKLTVIIINIAVYLVLKFYTVVPQSPIDPLYLKIISSLNVVSIFIIIAVLSAFFRKTVDNTLDELQLIASIDPLTGLYNRRTMYEKLNKDFRMSKRTRETFSVLIADIDNFKAFNDQYGHDCGDLVLIQCAEAIKEDVGELGDVSRWGGEEFLVLFHSADASQAAQMAEKLRKKINSQIFRYHELEFNLSITIGVATYNNNENISAVMKRADQALLSGKNDGKNIVKISGM